MIKTLKPCTVCSNTFFDVCTINQDAQCTNCYNKVDYKTRKAKGVFITTSSVEWGETYFLTKSGWVNMIGMDTQKNPITYTRITANIKGLLACAPYGAESIETKFYPSE